MAASVPLLQQNHRKGSRGISRLWDFGTIDVTADTRLVFGKAAPTVVCAPTDLGHVHHHIQSIASLSAVQQSSLPYIAYSPTSLAAASTTTFTTACTAATTAATTSQPANATSRAASPSQSAQVTLGGGSYRGNSLTGAAAAGTEYTGDFTWYQTGLGACGITSRTNDHIVAVSHNLFDQYATANPNDNPICGKMVTLTGVDGTLHTAKVVDRCTGCALSDLDLSEGFFNLVTDHGDGRVSGMHWVFR